MLLNAVRYSKQQSERARMHQIIGKSLICSLKCRIFPLIIADFSKVTRKAHFWLQFVWKHSSQVIELHNITGDPVNCWRYIKEFSLHIEEGWHVISRILHVSDLAKGSLCSLPSSVKSVGLTGILKFVLSSLVLAI